MLNQNNFSLFSVKRLTAIASLAFYLCSSLYAQGWFTLNTGTTATCNGVFFADANTGYVNITSGGSGFILKTTNAGSNWIQQTVPTTNWMRSVYFTDINTGYVVSGEPNSGYIGNICKTTNGGANWIQLPVQDTAHFCSIYFINPNTGFAAGYQMILKTTNAGSTWVSQSFPSGLQWFWSIHFVDANTGYAAESEDFLVWKHIIKTTNGGTDWQTVFADTGNGGFYGLHFIDANTGVAAGGQYSFAGSSIQRTTDGGVTWAETFADSINIGYLWSVRFVSPSIGFASGGNPGSNGLGVILKTTNAGLNWYPQTTNAAYGLLGNYFTSIDTGYVVGWGGHILKTTDGGGIIGIEPISNEVPSQFQLHQNYPNPFNPTTNIRIDLPENSFVNLKIYDIVGREVTSLVNKQLNSGTYEVDWNASNYPSGTYFYKLISGSYSVTKKMILIK